MSKATAMSYPPRAGAPGVRPAPDQAAVRHQRRADHDLMESLRVGDHEAFTELVRRHYKRLNSFIYRLTGDYEASCDLTQEAFIRLYQAAGGYRMCNAFSTYLYSIGKNLALDLLRHRRRHSLISLTSYRQRQGGDGERRDLEIVDARPLPDAALAVRERQVAMQTALASLQQSYLVPLLLRVIEGQSYKEIADRLNQREGTVKSRVSRARALLRARTLTSSVTPGLVSRRVSSNAPRGKRGHLGEDVPARS